jgi:hypothetical protein
MIRMHASRLSALPVLCLLLSGCMAYGVPPPGTRSLSGEVPPPPSIPAMLGMGPAPTPAAPAVAASPAPSAPAAAGAAVASAPAAAPKAGGGFDGTYGGTGVASRDIGSKCANTMPVTGMVVSGSDVSFGGFHGTLTWDGGVQMQYGRDFLNGYFSPAGFDGSLYQPFPGCTYHLVLTRQ